MPAYLVRRLLAFVPVLWVVATAVFLALRLTPGDPAQNLFAEAQLSPEQMAAQRTALGLDRPLAEQYADYLTRLLRVDFGESLFTHRPVTLTIAEQSWPTLELAAGGMIVAVILGLSLGLGAALRPGTWVGHLAEAAIALSQALPVAWTGLLGLWLVTATLRIHASLVEFLLLPAMALGFAACGALAAATRASVLAVQAERHVLADRARGFAGWPLLRHTLRVALVPVTHLIALQAAFLFGGTVITETVFARPGLGRLLVDSLLRKDLPVVQGLVLFIAALYLAFNLAADLLAAALDPRLRSQWQ